MPVQVQWAPQWAAGKVEGIFTEFDPQNPPQRITMRCLVCGETAQRTCDSGNARHWITTFAMTHRAMHPW
jgi:hypothetical protein